MTVWPAGYALGCKSEIAVESRAGMGRCLVLRAASGLLFGDVSEVVAWHLGGEMFSAIPGGAARTVYRILHSLGAVSYTGARTGNDRPIWTVKCGDLEGREDAETAAHPLGQRRPRAHPAGAVQGAVWSGREALDAAPVVGEVPDRGRGW